MIELLPRVERYVPRHALDVDPFEPQRPRTTYRARHWIGDAGRGHWEADVAAISTRDKITARMNELRRAQTGERPRPRKTSTTRIPKPPERGSAR